ncbi:MAG TPA: hypothetical protein PL045_11200 [Chitinophagaceae bacterium]|nr:hypothetical protein [Chitinophagaceae bacterium]
MKTILLITAFLLAAFTNAFAEKTDDKEIAVVAGLLMQNENAAVITNNVQVKEMTYNGTKVTAYIGSDKEMICFGRIINTQELPADATDLIRKKFKNCQLQKAAIIVTADGNISYYACIQEKTDLTLLKISPDCKILYMKKQINKQNISKAS